MTSTLFRHTHVVGLGLMGGSVAKALRKFSLTETISANDPLLLDFTEIDASGIQASTRLDDKILSRADLIIFACPPSVFAETLTKVAPFVTEDAILTDVLSVKQMVMEAANSYPFSKRFIPSHPIAGTERSGFAASDPQILDRRRVILTPSEEADPDAVQKIQQLWMACGMVPEAMHPVMHDLTYALVSHLPQILAYASADILSCYSVPNERRQLPFLRIAGSNPLLWSDICLANRQPLVAALATYIAVLRHVIDELSQREALRFPDPDAIISLFPRIVASCLISTIATVETQEKMVLSRYAGQGFADLVSPAATAPEKDIETISQCFGALLEPLEKMTAYLERIANALENNNAAEVLEAFAHAKTSGEMWKSPRN